MSHELFVCPSVINCNFLSNANIAPFLAIRYHTIPYHSVSAPPIDQSPLLSKEKTGKIMRCRSFYRLSSRHGQQWTWTPSPNRHRQARQCLGFSRFRFPNTQHAGPACSYINFIKFATLWHLGLAVFTSVNYFQFG